MKYTKPPLSDPAGHNYTVNYTQDDWAEDKILILRLVMDRRYAEAQEHANLVFQAACPRNVMFQLMGALLVLDALAADETR